VIVDRRERQQILGEWGVRSESVRERAAEALLERDLQGSPLVGRPLPSRPRPNRLAVDRYVVSLGGPAPYMRRLRQIELEIEAHERGLEEAWRALASECGGNERGFARRWRAAAEKWSFDALNDLIDRHNRYYPTEARLPMDVRTRDFALVNGRSYRHRKLGADWVLERFPAHLELTGISYY
jgi:hypothetical protein